MKMFCFILMPFGKKKDNNEKEIDFDIVYREFIKPAIEKAGLEPIRADEENAGGFIHKPMYERLLFCDFAIADLSFANANVFYELGIRHASRPYTTVSVFEVNTKLPFDVAPLRALPYQFANNTVNDVNSKIEALADMIRVNLDKPDKLADSPISQTIQQYRFPDLKDCRQQADAFRDWAMSLKEKQEKIAGYAEAWKKLQQQKASLDSQSDAFISLEARQKELVKQVKDIENGSGDLDFQDYELIFSLLNGYKKMSAFPEIIQLISGLGNDILQNNIFLKQQLALAYNKTNEREKSKEILIALIKKYGPDPETNGLLGAVYKGLMDDQQGSAAAAGYRKLAIRTYLEGFDADPRDYYPGINALTLMFYDNNSGEQYLRYLPLVEYAVERQLKKNAEDYWASATKLELQVLMGNAETALESLGNALATNPDNWAKASTKKNLEKIYGRHRETQQEPQLKWLQEIIDMLS